MTNGRPMEVVGTRAIIYGQTEPNKRIGNHPTQRFKNYLHNQYITLITVDHQNIYGKTIKFVPLPTKHLVAFVYHHHQQEIPGEYLDNPTGTNTLHSKCYLGGQEPGTGVGVGVNGCIHGSCMVDKMKEKGTKHLWLVMTRRKT
tara:strand:- start:27 stop:458 length:432 start_codon:yes stop_codon:yes gene_type:complete